MVVVVVMMERRLCLSEKIILNSYIIYTPKSLVIDICLSFFLHVCQSTPTPHLCFRNYATHKNLYLTRYYNIFSNNSPLKYCILKSCLISSYTLFLLKQMWFKMKYLKDTLVMYVYLFINCITILRTNAKLN